MRLYLSDKLVFHIVEIENLTSVQYFNLGTGFIFFRENLICPMTVMNGMFCKWPRKWPFFLTPPTTVSLL